MHKLLALLALTPCDTKPNQDDIKKEGAMDVKVLPLDPCGGNRPHWVRLKRNAVENKFNCCLTTKKKSLKDIHTLGLIGLDPSVLANIA